MKAKTKIQKQQQHRDSNYNKLKTNSCRNHCEKFSECLGAATQQQNVAAQQPESRAHFCVGMHRLCWHCVFVCANDSGARRMRGGDNCGSKQSALATERGISICKQRMQKRVGCSDLLLVPRKRVN